MKPTRFQNEPCSPDTSKANINNFVNIFGLIFKAKIALRPVYTLRFVDPICRPDSVGAQIVRVF